MKTLSFIMVLSLSLLTMACAQNSKSSLSKEKEASHDHENMVVKSETEWKETLSEQEYYVMREQGTERAFTGEFWDFKGTGIYTCGGCGQELFDSETKFKSGTGWPSFYDVFREENVGIDTDRAFGMVRNEVHCSSCNGHLGHVFDDGPRPTGLRYCINSASLDFVEAKK